MRRLSLALLFATAVALVVAAVAAAGFWGWGPGQLSASTTNGACPLYTTGSVCSGWNYWYSNYTTQEDGGSGQYLCGFQTSSAVRGVYKQGPYSTCQVVPSQFGWGGWYLKVGNTHKRAIVPSTPDIAVTLIIQGSS